MRARVGIAALLILSGCAAEPSPTSSDGIPAPTRHFVGAGVSFDYPGTWREGHFDVVSTASVSIVFLSTAPLVDPCVRAPAAVTCGMEAVRALDADGIAVGWSANGFPGWTFDPTVGRRIAVGGRAATIEDIAADDLCSRVGGDRLLDIIIDQPAVRWNWTSVRACLRGPDLDGLRAQVGAMLGSVVWH